MIKVNLSINANNDERMIPAKIEPNVIPINNLPKFLMRLIIFSHGLLLLHLTL